LQSVDASLYQTNEQPAAQTTENDAATPTNDEPAEPSEVIDPEKDNQ
jgi:hypothetical protein